MKPQKTYKFEGITYEITKFNIGKGGQGTVHKARRRDDHSQKAIIKELPFTAVQYERIEALVASGMGLDQPLVSMPLSVNHNRKQDKIYYLATFCRGISLENDHPRSFPQLLEVSTILSHIWAGFENRGFAHGDISFTNIMINGSGKPEVIDTDNYDSTVIAVPKPTKLGQHPVIAPELRLAKTNNQNRPPDMLSDRFAWGNVFSFLTLGRHCCDGLVNNNPGKFDQLMMGGTWPEHIRRPEQGETPFQALGGNLISLFENSFSVRPHDRPSAEDWKQGFTNALEQIHVHECGGAFVADPGQSSCPYCQAKIVIQQRSKGTTQLLFRHIDTGIISKFDLVDGQYMCIGRNNLKNASPYISSRHLRVMKQGKKLYLAHVGKNPTQITFASNSCTYQLKTGEIKINDPKLKGAVFQLADSRFEISVKR